MYTMKTENKMFIEYYRDVYKIVCDYIRRHPRRNPPINHMRLHIACSKYDAYLHNEQDKSNTALLYDTYTVGLFVLCKFSGTYDVSL